MKLANTPEFKEFNYYAEELAEIQYKVKRLQERLRVYDTFEANSARNILTMSFNSLEEARSWLING